MHTKYPLSDALIVTAHPVEAVVEASAAVTAVEAVEAAVARHAT